MVRGLGLEAPITGPIAEPRDQPDGTLLLVPADQPAHLARGQSEPRSDRMLLELSVDKSLNAFKPIQFAHRHGHLGYPDHGQSPRPKRRSAESGSRGPKRTFLLSGKRTFLFGYHILSMNNPSYVKYRSFWCNAVSSSFIGLHSA